MTEAVRAVRIANSSAGAPLHPARLPFPDPMTREWAWGDGQGTGVRVCLIDSGVDATHPAVGPVAAYAVRTDEHDEPVAVVPDDAGDAAGHGTACAGIIRALAPRCALTSVRILGSSLRGRGEVLCAAVEWAIRENFKVINLSLSTRQARHKERLHDLADEAYFKGLIIVASAHNGPWNSYPWRFPATISVGSHDQGKPEHLEANPSPPVEFFAHGVNVETARAGGGTCRMSGNSFATPHVTGLCARVLGRHPDFGVAQVRQVLAAIANNLDG
jgi:subtilisin family serine protease